MPDQREEAPICKGLDEIIRLGSGELTSLRQMAASGRLLLRHSGSYNPAGVTIPRKAHWADVASVSDPNSTEGFEITQATYAALRDMGAPEPSAV